MTRVRAREIALLAGLCLMLAVGCKRKRDDGGSKPAGEPAAQPATDAAPAATPARWVRAATVMPSGVEIPWLVSLPPAGQNGRAVVANGRERIEVTARSAGDAITLAWPEYETRVELAPGEDGALSGSWTRASETFGEVTLPVRAAPVSGPELAALFPAGEAGASESAPGPSPVGVWQIELADGTAVRAVIQPWAEAEAGAGAGEPLVVALQFETSDTADIVLSGMRTGRRVRASGFDGNFAYMIDAEVDTGGPGEAGEAGASRMRGTLYVAGTGEFALTGARDDAFALPPVIPVEADGPALAVAAEPRYAGSPLLVDIAASWCPPCQRSAPFLAALERRYRARGLKLVTLLYEFTGDPAVNARRAAAFRAEHEISWEVRPMDAELDEFAATLPRELAVTLDNIKNLPLVLFVDRTGRIRQVHTGYVGPELPDEHQRIEAVFTTGIEAILE